MNLSNDLISQFVKMTKDDKEEKKEAILFGTTVSHNGRTYVKIDGSDLLTPISTTADVVPGERVTVMIKNHSATVTGNISSPAARTDDVKDVATKISEFEIIIADQVTIEQLNAEKARIDELRAENATIKQTLTANNADISKLQADYIEVDKTLLANDADIENLKTTKLDASIAKVTYATIKNLDAANADINNLEATFGEFREVATDRLDAVDATIEELTAGQITTGQLDAKYATIASLNTEKARIDTLDSEVGEIDTLIFGSASGDTIQTSFSNSVISQLGDAQIKSAMIESIAAGKITSGDIITNNVRVKSQNGQLLIADETMQISDSTRVRVQIGKDAADDYSINVWDEAGNLMFSKGGITDSAIKNAIIRNDMVSDTANIAAHKLDIDSLFSEINGSSNTIKSSKVYLDDEKQTLDVAFKAMTTEVDDLKSSTTSQGTQLSVVQGQIASKVWQQDITSESNKIKETTDSLSTQYSALEQDLDSISATVASNTSSIAKKADSSTVTTVSNKVASLETNLDGFKSTVSDTYSTKEALNNLQIGGRNVIRGTRDFIIDNARVNGWENTHNFTITKDEEHNCYVATRAASGLTTNSIKSLQSSKYPCKKGDVITFSVWMKVTDVDAWDAQYPYIFEVFDSEGTRIQFYDSHITNHYTNRPTVVSGEWVRFISTYNVTEDDASSVAMRLTLFRNGEISFKLAKVEFGSKATDWTPAPEDMATYTEVASLTERMSTAETSITQNTEEIELKASKTEVTEAVNGITVGGRNLFENSGDLKQSAFGGYQYYFGESVYGDDPLVPSGKYIGVTATSLGTSGNFGPYLNAPFGDYVKKMTVGETYTASVWIKCTTAKTKGVIRAEFLSNAKDIAPPLSTEWQRYSTTGTYNGHTTSGVAITFYYGTELNVDDIFYVSSPMIELGNKATDWKPAPEDLATAQQLSLVETRVTAAETSITQNAESIELKANKTELDSVANRMSSAETKITQNANNISSIASRAITLEGQLSAAQTSITQNADGISAVAARTTSNESAIAQLELNADGLSVRLGTAEGNITTAQNTANTAKTDAATAQSTANTAKTNAATAQTTADTAKTNAAAAQNTANNATNTASSAYLRTQIYSDVTNYAQLNDHTADHWGFTVDTTADGHWYIVKALARDKWLSNEHQCKGGESFKITFEISTSCKGNSSNGGTDSVYRGTAIGLYGFDAEGTSVGINYSTRVMATEDAPATAVSSIVRVSSNARKFRVFLQTESYANFSGTIKIRKVRVDKIDDEASKTATNYLNFSSDGLVVGDHTGNSLGKNVLIDSDSVDIRDGSTVVASFGANDILLGQASEESKITMCGVATIQATNESGSGAYYYDGIRIDSHHFGVLSDHLTLMTDAYPEADYTASNQSYASFSSESYENYSGNRISTDAKSPEYYTRSNIGVYANAGNEGQPDSKILISIDQRDYTGSSMVWNEQRLTMTPTSTTLLDYRSGLSGPIRPWQKTLWSGAWFMLDSQTATLSEAVSTQPNGIILVFREYTDGSMSNSGLHTYYVPKQLVTDGAWGHSISWAHHNGNYFVCKYVYIRDTEIVGNALNDDTGVERTPSTIVTTNNKVVLWKVYGV